MEMQRKMTSCDGNKHFHKAVECCEGRFGFSDPFLIAQRYFEFLFHFQFKFVVNI